MKTKFLVRFLNNSAHLDADLDLVDIISLANVDGRLKQDNSQYIFDFVDPNRHSKLSSRADSDKSRKLAVGHLKSTVRAAFVKRLYEITTIYFHEVLKSATVIGLEVDKIIGEHSSSFSSRELIQLGSYDNIIDKISSNIFRQLENERSTKKLIEKIDKKLGLSIDNETVINAIPYMEIRHLMVHNGGKADKNFCNSFPQISAEIGKVIKVTNTIINNSRTSLISLIKEFDKKIVAKELVLETDLQP